MGTNRSVVMTTVSDVVSKYAYPCTKVITHLGTCLTYASEFIHETNTYVHQDVAGFAKGLIFIGFWLVGFGAVNIVMLTSVEIIMKIRNRQDLKEIARLEKTLGTQTNVTVV